jgi:hypothetical protein
LIIFNPNPQSPNPDPDRPTFIIPANATTLYRLLGLAPFTHFPLTNSKKGPFLAHLIRTQRRRRRAGQEKKKMEREKKEEFLTL